jgi:hypothetical protein
MNRAPTKLYVILVGAPFMAPAFNMPAHYKRSWMPAVTSVEVATVGIGVLETTIL